AETLEALLDSALDDVLQVNDPEHAVAVAHGERRPTGVANAVRDGLDLAGRGSAEIPHVSHDRVDGSFPNRAAVQVASAHARLRREGNELRAHLFNVACAQLVALLGQDDDGAPFWRFIGQA